jgi:hypothetical protein
VKTTPNEGETLSIVKTIGVAIPARGRSMKLRHRASSRRGGRRPPGVAAGFCTRAPRDSPEHIV